MNDIYSKIENFKEDNNLTYKDLGELISVSADTFRMSIKRKKLSKLRIERLEKIINGEQNEKILIK